MLCENLVSCHAEISFHDHEGEVESCHTYLPKVLEVGRQRNMVYYETYKGIALAKVFQSKEVSLTKHRKHSRNASRKAGLGFGLRVHDIRTWFGLE